jgi:cytochrome c peroxidase
MKNAHYAAHCYAALSFATVTWPLCALGALFACSEPALAPLGEPVLLGATQQALRDEQGRREPGRRLFQDETFAGNGRTCSTCHGAATGTVAPEEAQARFLEDAGDPLFLHDGSDDGRGQGVSRMLEHATILVTIPLPPNVSVADEPEARSVVLRRGIPSTLNTPALDPMLMLDGREPDLLSQAAGAIREHAQRPLEPSQEQLQAIADFEQSRGFFSSRELRQFARGGAAPELPEGCTPAERRGRRFFEDLPGGPTLKDGLCANCHSGPLLDRTNQFLPLPLPVGSRFQTVGVSELNAMGNPVRDFIFSNPDGSTTIVSSPDPGRALISGQLSTTGDQQNAFKISSLWGIARTAPYFHDNSAKTLEDAVKHYAQFFQLVTDPDGPGPQPPALVLTEQEQADIVAYLRLL